MIRAQRGAWFIPGMSLVVLSAIYAICGGIAGARFALAAIDAHLERVDAAISRLQKFNWGTDAFETIWLRGSVRLGIWDEAYDDERDRDARWKLLQDAAADFRAAFLLEPGSGRALSGLADVYARAEYETGDLRTLDVSALELGPWAQLGREGRVSIGLREMAVAFEPNVATRHAKLVRGLIEAGCKPEAAVAIAQAARVQPCFFNYKGFTLDTISPPLVDAFAKASREALGTTPLMRRHRHLLCLGQLERARGRPQQAYDDLTSAASGRIGDQDRAEIQFWLGYVDLDLGRNDEAIATFERSGQFPSFRVGAAIGRAQAFRALGRFRDEIDALAEARRVDPNNLGVLLTYAEASRAAGEPARAVEALRWSVLVRPDSAPAWTMLVETLSSSGEKAQATEALNGMTRALGENDETRRLREKLTTPP